MRKAHPRVVFFATTASLVGFVIFVATVPQDGPLPMERKLFKPSGHPEPFVPPAKAPRVERRPMTAEERDRDLLIRALGVDPADLEGGVR